MSVDPATLPRLEQLRCDRRLTYDQLATEWDTSRETVRRICLGLSFPRRPLLQRIVAWCVRVNWTLTVADLSPEKETVDA